MATFSFPAATFVIEGDPEAVRETGRAYGRFATTAGEAGADLRALDSGGWVGSEGDAFRARLGEIPPHLDVAHGAFAQVARALDGFADELASAQGRMDGVRADAEQTHASLARADGDGSDQRGLQDAFDDQLGAAAGLRAQVLAAAQRAAAAIRAAGRSSPTASQGWLAAAWEDGRRWVADRVDDLKSFVAEHASALRMVAKVLRWVGMALVAVGAALAAISFVAGVFSFGIGWLGEIPAGAVLGTGMVLWGAGDALDTTVDWAEGRISGRELVFRTGFALATAFVGGLAVKFGGKVLDKLAPRLAEKLRRLVDDVVRPALADERGSVGLPGGRLPDVDHGAVRGLVDQVGVAATREQALDDLARTFGVTPERLRDLATDPATGRLDRGGAEEAAAILGAERRGLLPEGMVRSHSPGADFEVPQGAQGSGGTEWDVKSFRSTVPDPGGRGDFKLDTAVRSLQRELRAGENVLVNTVHLTPEHVDQLRRAVADNGWIDRVVFYP